MAGCFESAIENFEDGSQKWRFVSEHGQESGNHPSSMGLMKKGKRRRGDEDEPDEAAERHRHPPKLGPSARVAPIR
jgi:hypothetical protein